MAAQSACKPMSYTFISAENSTSTEVLLMGDRFTGKIIYLEAKKEFVDLLLSLLHLPLGRVMQLLAAGPQEESAVIGKCQLGPCNARAMPLMSLYKSVSQLNGDELCVDKKSLLQPQYLACLDNIGDHAFSAKVLTALLEGGKALPWPYVPATEQVVKKDYFKCSHPSCYNISTVQNSTCPGVTHSGPFNSSGGFFSFSPVDSSQPTFPPSASKAKCGYANRFSKFLVTNDLEILEHSISIAIGLLAHHDKDGDTSGLKKFYSAEVKVGVLEVLKIVKASMTGKCVLDEALGHIYKAKVASLPAAASHSL